jgi:guanine deaminase
LKDFDLAGCEIYTTGYPCPMCFGAILWANINKVYYGCNTTDTEIIGFRDKEFFESPEKRVSSFVLDREECKKLFDKYQRLSNKKMY